MTSAKQAMPGRMLLVFGGMVVLALLLHIEVGSGHLTLGQVLVEMGRGPHAGASPENAIVWQIRLPRALACLLVGANLAMVGSAFQALFRNPLAEPYIVGVSSGAAVGGTLAIVLGFGGMMGGLGTMLAGFATGLATLALVTALARRGGRLDVEALLLAGVVAGSLLGAMVTLVIFAAGANPLHVLRWLLGSMTPMTWFRVLALALVLAIGSALLMRHTKQLNTFAVGEEVAMRLGVSTRTLKAMVLITGTAMVAVSVGTVGVIGFLGLVAPHLSRRLVGVDWRWSMAGS
ncbi:MAG TPA: iron ABC transporter permease, partial [Fimbriimonadaceae bacterium]|nr:iron ABC transporter permease [Fimbriimonadaceae bacterium]